MIISGFLMAWHYYDRAEEEPWENPQTWMSFYLRRFFRIAPTYYLVLGAAFLTARHYASWWVALNSTAPGSAPIDASAFEPTFRSLVLHVTFLFGFLPRYVDSIIAIPDWSIALEMQFYLAFPFLMLALRRWGVVPITISVIVGTVVVYQLWGVYSTGHGYLGVFPQPSFLPFKLSWFLVGILFADSVYRREHGQPSVAALSAAIGLFMNYRGHSTTLAVITLGFLILAHRSWLAPALGPVAGLVSKMDQALSSRICTFLADCSYSVYLIHFFAIYPIESALHSSAFLVGVDPLVRAGLLFAATLAAVLPVAYVLHRFVERPGIELGKSLLKGAFSREAHVSVG